MNRSKKYCVYRECTTNSVNNPELTLFQFPKNEERAAKWCELGEVDPFDGRARFMCELHFPRIYMCFSARRKMLLSMAVPRAFGTTEADDSEQSMLQSSADIAVEEHLDESIMDDNDELATEIIYMNDQDFESDEHEPTTTKKLLLSKECTPNMPKIKLDKVSNPSRSVVVSSSSTKTVVQSLKSIPHASPQTKILRKIKLKKRPINLKPIEVKVPNTPLQEVSSSPAMRTNATVLDKKEPDEIICSVGTAFTVESSSSTVVENNMNVKSANENESQKMDADHKQWEEPLYEFIFKGEEYVQMPKARYYDERKEWETKLEQSTKQAERLKKKIEFYQRSFKDLNHFLHKLSDENDDDD